MYTSDNQFNKNLVTPYNRHETPRIGTKEPTIEEETVDRGFETNRPLVEPESGQTELEYDDDEEKIV